MLSRILSARDAERIEFVLYQPSTLPNCHPKPHPPAVDEGGPEREMQELRTRIAQLMAETEMAGRDSFEAGRREGDQQARAELGPVLERVNASLAELTGFRPEMRRRAEKDVVQLALLIARRVLHRELNVDPQALMALARVIFERLARAESYQVTVHPGFAAAITAALPPGQAGRVTIDADPACALGTLIVRSAEGVVDASVDSQLEEITRGLTDRLARAEGSTRGSAPSSSRGSAKGSQ